MLVICFLVRPHCTVIRINFMSRRRDYNYVHVQRTLNPNTSVTSKYVWINVFSG